MPRQEYYCPVCQIWHGGYQVCDRSRNELIPRNANPLRKSAPWRQPKPRPSRDVR